MMHCCRFYAYFMLLTLPAPLWADPPAPAASSAQPVLAGLVGKHRVVGFTVQGGKRFLGRVLSGDHGLYVVETFHYASAPATATETTMQTGFVAGRFGRLRPVTRRVKTKETTQKTIPDTVAVQALLRGVAGPSFRPAEQPAGREIIAPADVTCLQELLPPLAATPVSSATPAAPSATPAGTTAATRPAAGWTLRTLWTAPK